MAKVGLVGRGQLGHFICFGVFSPRYVSDLESIEEADKGECHVPVSPHRAILGVEFPRDLADDELGVTEHPYLLGAHGGGQLQPDQQGFVRGIIVGGLKSKPKGVFNLNSVGGG